MLHTVNKSPFDGTALESCLRLARPGSAVLLIEDGIYAAIKGTGAAARLQQAMPRLSVYALGPDLKARGVEDARVADGIRVVDYGGFVDLAVEHPAVQAWL